MKIINKCRTMSFQQLLSFCLARGEISVTSISLLNKKLHMNSRSGVGAVSCVGKFPVRSLF